MAGKAAEKMMATVGGNIRESIGKGAGQSPRQPPPLPPKPAHEIGVRPSRESFEIEIERLMPDPDQPRKTFAAEDTREMADSLLKNGQITPITARFSTTEGKWMIVAGERRYQGALLAGLKVLKVERDATTDTTDRRRKQLAENLHRRDLPPKETALAFQELMDLNGWSTTQLASEMGINQPRVVQALALLRQPELVQAMVEDGTLKPATAYEISKAGDHAEQVRIAERVVKDKVSRDDTRDLVRESVARADAQPAPAGPASPARPGRKVGSGRKKAPASWRTRVDGYTVQVERAKGLDPEDTLAALVAAVDRYTAEHLAAGSL